jgi:hypothetical protein
VGHIGIPTLCSLNDSGGRANETDLRRHGGDRSRRDR